MHTDAMNDVIDVKSLRESLGWTQERLAEELGLDRSTVSRLEAGQEPHGSTGILLRRLRDAVAAGEFRPHPLAPD
jgi:transcriptional regulator with XRE-family HTH domain